MKIKILYLLSVITFLHLQGCVANEETGQMEPGWLFWVFLGLLLGVLFIGALVNLIRKKKPTDIPSKAEQEMEAYEETLNKKLEKDSEKEDERKKD